MILYRFFMLAGMFKLLTVLTSMKMDSIILTVVAILVADKLIEEISKGGESHR